ncbi:hypothetical protein FACS1894179_09000 [Bacteroidia bacterium]|nr:hypothetical protein FACS1894169_12380 [Bacteroidia bacterium]GHV41239.1 hypothetical protein FACS1894179_09000 [Bacteroidia bacterium]
MISTKADIREYFYIPDNQILYVEKEYNEFLNVCFNNVEEFESLFSHHYKTLNDGLYKESNFIYIPKLINKWSSKSGIDSLNDVLSYNHPALYIDSVKINNLLKIDTVSYTKFISKMFDNSFSEQIDSGLLMYSYRLGEFIYFPLRAKDLDTLIREIEVFFKELKVRLSNADFDNYALSFPPDRDNIPDDEKTDYDFTYRNKIADEIKERISTLKKLGHEEFLLRLITKEILKIDSDTELQSIVHDLTFYRDFVLAEPKEINRIERFKEFYLTDKVSPLIIDQSYRILLPEYNNLEIKLTPLQKAVYFLFLRHREGILFKRLGYYRRELQDIYCDISNRECLDSIEKSIDDICNPAENSINEKCSRIKEAFLSQFTGEIAGNYYITGDRGYPKVISLDRALVTWKVRLSYDDRDEDIMTPEDFDINNL